MRDEILGRVNADLLSVPPLISRLIRKKLVSKNLGDPEIELKIPHFEIMRTLKEEGTLHPAEIGQKLFIARAQMTAQPSANSSPTGQPLPPAPGNAPARDPR